MSRRERFFSGIDSLVLRMATRKYVMFGPSILYQDLPWSGIRGARRAEGSKERLEAMLEYLSGREIAMANVLDIGCNVGYFSLSFAERGAISYGVDDDPLALRIATISSKDIRTDFGRFVPVRMSCTPVTMPRMPSADVSLCLSIWHHWVRHQGLDAATEMLTALWEKTGSIMFFDTGENEMPAEFDLPFRGKDAVSWLKQYLANSLRMGTVSALGEFKAFSPSDESEDASNVTRTLFAITRSS